MFISFIPDLPKNLPESDLVAAAVGLQSKGPGTGGKASRHIGPKKAKKSTVRELEMLESIYVKSVSAHKCSKLISMTKKETFPVQELHSDKHRLSVGLFQFVL